MDRITVCGVSRNYFNMPVWMAEHHGFFAEEGLQVTSELYEELDEPLIRVRDGRAQFARHSAELNVMDHEAGGRQVIIGGNVNKLPFSLIARPEIKTIEDMRGKTFGVGLLTAGSSSLIMRILATHGLHYPDDYKIAQVGPILKRWDMLRTGEIDAGLQGIPLNFVALDAGYTSLLTPSDGIPEFQTSCFSVDSQWAKSSRDLVVRFMRAILKSWNLYFADKGSTIELAMQKCGINRDYAGRAWDAHVEQGIFPRNGDINMAGMRTLLELGAAARNLPSRAIIDLNDIVDRSYLEEARATLK